MYEYRKSRLGGRSSHFKTNTVEQLKRFGGIATKHIYLVEYMANKCSISDEWAIRKFSKFYKVHFLIHIENSVILFSACVLRY